MWIKKFLLPALVLVLMLAACVPVPTPTPTPEATTPAPGMGMEEQPFQITGEFQYSNAIITDYFDEHMVALVDIYGFVTRDLEWEIPISSQTLGFLEIDEQAMQASFVLQLPARPTATFVDVDNDSLVETGVQVFVIAYWPNLYGSPYSTADDRSRGWPSYLTSVRTDTENQDEVIGGKLIIWSPDNEQSFPSGFGDDGLLFTADDPSMPVRAGYSIIDLDSAPFAVIREPEPVVTLYEPQDVAIKDFSADSYTVAFDKMFEIVRKEYAFSDIPNKSPDWDALYERLKPRVEEAQANADALAFYLALREFTLAFRDGHVSLDGGEAGYQYFVEQTAAGYGFAIRELDDGRVIVTYILPGSPAAAAGLALGAEITHWNDQPIAEALDTVIPFSAPHSTDFSLRYQQTRYLLRTTPGTEVTLTFINPDTELSQQITLAAISERDSFGVTSIFAGFDENALPVEFEILASGVGYLKINSNYDNLNLIVRLFERALQTFERNQVPGIIIDLRQNSGGAPLGLAGFLTDNEIYLGQLEYYSDATGRFEPDGLPDIVLPNTNQYRFDKMVLLVGQACASACELEAYAFSQVPGMTVVGEYPTAGVEAEVARGQFILPDGMYLQVPTGRFVRPDGSVFLEGVGVQPDLRVPIDENLVLSSQDEILKFGERVVLQPLGAGITPSSPPTIMSAAEALRALETGAEFFESIAREEYTIADFSVPGTLTYTITLTKSEPLIWAYGWCASSQQQLAQNFEDISLEFTLAGNVLASEQIQEYDYVVPGQACRIRYVALTDWAGGEHHLKVKAVFLKPIDDGSTIYPAGMYSYEYTVYVKP